MSSVQGVVNVLGRVLLCAIFAMSALGNKIPHFSEVAGLMERVGVPAPQLLLTGAIVFLLVGSALVVVGYRARIGAALLLVFLVLATYYFHAFWKLEGQAQQEQMTHFLKNVALMGAFLILIARGSGPLSLDDYLARRGQASTPTASVNERIPVRV